MKSNTLLGVSMSLAAILVQAGCGTNSEASANPAGSGTIGGVRGNAFAGTAILPEGTLLAVRTSSALSSNTQEAGQTFSANLEHPLLLDGREVAAKGARVEGTIVNADKGGRVKGVASLTVRLTGLQAGAEFVDISTNSVTRNARTTKKTDAVKIAVGSGVGAAIGAIAGGGKGAAIGAAAGGGAGTGVVLATRGAAAVIPSESLLSFSLRAPVTVTVSR